MKVNKSPNMKFSEGMVWKIWSKGMIEGGNDPVFWRKDDFGAWIFCSHYDNRNSEYGWVIDYIKPVSEGGTKDISNLRPVHWENTVRNADGKIKPRRTSAGVHNGEPMDNKVIEIPNLNIMNWH